MATAKKAAPKAAEPTEADAPVVRPHHTNLLCAECGQHPLDPTATSFTCEHGSWSFVDADDDETDPDAE